MKSVLPITALIALLGTSSAMAANFTIPMSFEYLALDGKKIETNRFNHKADISLDNGTHKIAIRYNEMVEDDFTDSQSFVKSSPFIVTIAVDGDYNYTLAPAEGEVVKHPIKFAKSPQVVIKRQDGGDVSYKIMQTDITEESFVSKLFGNNNHFENNNTQVAAITATGAAVATSNTGATNVGYRTLPAKIDGTVEARTLPAQINGNTADANHAQQMLQYWWLHADDETRKEFMSWAIKQL